MTNHYGSYYTNEKREYERYYLASGFLTDTSYITDPGSGSLQDSQLVHAAVGNPWSVSRWGGELQRINITAKQYGGWETNALAIPQEQEEPQILTTRDKLEEIRDIFGLSISHLAKVLCTSRPSLHSWLEGGEPRDLAIDRITQIYQVAKTWKHMSLFHYSPGRLMRQPLGNGPSMLERLERETLIDAEISDGLDKLLQLMQRQHEQMERSKARSNNSTRTEREKANTRHRLTKTVTSSSD